MKKYITFVVCYFIFAIPVHAIYDPLSVPNNRIGIHVLDPTEILSASQLVNSNGGSWGYVTVPIRSDDRDYFKWSTFFKYCSELHLIPIIRLATYSIGNSWAEPSELDLLDFANFLNLFPWPTQNRYIILFNEPNHAKEWGDFIDPENYVVLAKSAHQIFKDASPDFFLLTAGLDMSAPNNHTSIDALVYYRRMFAKDPAWPEYFDGFSFHPYPNPGFKASPYTKNRYGIRSYEFELNYLKRFKVVPKYLFFTETGTHLKNNFYLPAFTSVWRDPRIVAITPFLLYAGSGDFVPFSLQNTPNYREIQNLPKVLGSPLLAQFPKLPQFNQSPADSLPAQISVRSWWQSVINYLLK